MKKNSIDGDSPILPAPSKEITTNTSESSNYINICNSEYLKLFKVGDTNGR